MDQMVEGVVGQYFLAYIKKFWGFKTLGETLYKMYRVTARLPWGKNFILHWNMCFSKERENFFAPSRTFTSIWNRHMFKVIVIAYIGRYFTIDSLMYFTSLVQILQTPNSINKHVAKKTPVITKLVNCKWEISLKQNPTKSRINKHKQIKTSAGDMFDEADQVLQHHCPRALWPRFRDRALIVERKLWRRGLAAA